MLKLHWLPACCRIKTKLCTIVQSLDYKYGHIHTSVCSSYLNIAAGAWEPFFFNRGLEVKKSSFIM